MNKREERPPAKKAAPESSQTQDTTSLDTMANVTLTSQTPSLDIEAASDFIGWLYDDTDKLISVVSKVDWNGGFFEPFMLADIEDYVTNADAKSAEGIYFRVTTLAETPVKGRGVAADSARLTALWSDIDIAGPGHVDKSGKLPPNEEAARKIIETSSLPEPSLWIHSGGGMYPIWKITDGNITAANYAEMTQLSKDFHAEIERSAEALGWSVAPMGDLARVLRLPGTVNRKAGLSRPCRVVERSEAVYSVAEIRAAIPAQTEAESVSVESGDIWESLPDDGGMCRAIMRKFKQWDEKLRTAENGSRHKTALSAIGSIISVGNLGHSGAREAITKLEEVFNGIKPASEQGQNEWESLVDYVVSKTEIHEDRSCCGDWAFTEAHMANRVADEVLQGHFRWSEGTDWIRWDDRVWKRVSDAVVAQEAKEWLIDGFRQAAKAFAMSTRDKALEEVMKGWKRMLGATPITNIVKLARAVPGIKFESHETDSDLDLLNCLNGVVDLRTGTLMEHDPKYLMTKIAGAKYVPNATHSIWDTALGAMPPHIREWMQIRFGQAATGYMTPDDILPVLNGGGGNGKTSVVTGVKNALGNYCVLASDRVLLGNAVRDETMEFKGARMALIEELPESGRMDTVRLKKTVGSVDMKGHHLYQSEMTWKATHSLFVSSNYRPMITETDEGVWRRLALVVFPYRFVKNPKGPHERKGDMKIRMRIEEGDSEILEAVLSWIVNGAKKFYEDDKIMPDIPESVTDDTDEWRKTADMIFAYWDSVIVADPDSHVMGTDLHKNFNEWMKEQGNREWSSKVLVSRFMDHTDTKNARVTKKSKARLNQKGIGRLSRPIGTQGVPSGQYTAWVGMRFCDDDDPMS